MKGLLAVLAAGLLTAAAGPALPKSKRVASPDIPATSFSCEGRHNGYYADVDTDCQVYHMCLGREQFSYLCPNTTRFQQRMMVCDHWYQVDCPAAPLSYSANLLIGQRDKPFVGDDEHRAIHEAAVRTSKGLLKAAGLLTANQIGSIEQKVDKRPFLQQPPQPPQATFRPPSVALEAPLSDDDDSGHRHGGFFQRSPTSSFAQPFQNQLQQFAERTQPPFQPAFRPASPSAPAPSAPAFFSPPTPPPSTTPAPPAQTSTPGSVQHPRVTGSTLSFKFAPTATPASTPGFSISFTPSPSFPASGHNLQRLGVARDLPRAPSSELEAPYFAERGDAPSSAFARRPDDSVIAASSPRTPALESEHPESMAVSQSGAFVAPFNLQVSNAISPPSRELSPPDLNDFPTGVASGPGSSPRPFALFNGFNASVPRLSLFAATSPPSRASTPSPSPRFRATPEPPSRELQVPEEGEENFNTVEVKYQDPRRLFFIPNSPGELPEDDSNPVVVIKYPTKGVHSRSTMRLKSYAQDVKQRTDPSCPRCHPDFVVPGSCNPCVLLR